MNLKKKVGPLPVWAWIVLVGVIGLYAYERSKSSESEASGVEEGFSPTQGLPAEGQGSGAASGGVTAAEEFMQRGQEAAEGRAIAAEEASQERQIAHEEAVEGREVSHLEAQETRENGLSELLAELPYAAEEKAAKALGQTQRATVAAEKRQAAREKRTQAKEVRASKSNREGKAGKGSGQKKREGRNPNAGQNHHTSHNNHQPGHAAKTDHRPAAPARTRVRGGGGTQAPKKSKPRKKK